MATSGLDETVVKIKIEKLRNLDLDLYTIKVPPDGSCFFHSILRAFHREYIKADKLETRILLCRKLRESLSECLEEKNPATGKTEYDTLGNGYYKDFNEAVKDVDGDRYSLGALQKELLSNRPVSHAYIEILGNHLKLDIYLINITTGDVYLTGTDTKLLYKNRNSIVLLYRPGHYDIIGIKKSTLALGCDDIVFDCLFDTNHEFIAKIKQRINELLSA